MKSKAVLESAEIKAIAHAAEAEALKNQWRVTIAIVDDGGHLLHLSRLDDAVPMSAQVAPAKARRAALGRRESKIFEDMINGGRTAFLSVPAWTRLYSPRRSVAFSLRKSMQDFT